MTNQKEIKTNIIISDMTQAGFKARLNLNGDCQIQGFFNRPINMMEIETAMDQAGYEKCQYTLSYAYSSIIITAL